MNVRDHIGRILCGVDALGLSTPAVVRTLLLAKELEARPKLVHALETRPGREAVDSEQILEEARRKGLHIVARARLEAGYTQRGPEDLFCVHPGHPAQVLLKLAERFEAGLIVLGPHIKQSFLDFGGTARIVLARSPVPVWVQADEVEPVKRILVGVDFSEHSRRALEIAIDLAEIFGASVCALHAHIPPSLAYSTSVENFAGPVHLVDHERELALSELDAWMGSFDRGTVTIDSRFVEADAVTAIAEAARDMDLLVLGTHGRTGLTRFLLGSVAYASLKRTSTPVLVVPAQRESWLLAEGELIPEQRRGGTAPAF